LRKRTTGHASKPQNEKTSEKFQFSQRSALRKKFIFVKPYINFFLTKLYQPKAENENQQKKKKQPIQKKKKKNIFSKLPFFDLLNQSVFQPPLSHLTTLPSIE